MTDRLDPIRVGAAPIDAELPAPRLDWDATIATPLLSASEGRLWSVALRDGTPSSRLAICPNSPACWPV